MKPKYKRIKCKRILTPVEKRIIECERLRKIELLEDALRLSKEIENKP